MTVFILKYLFLFVTGSFMGWGIEVVYRRYLGEARKWINPGFLSGPYLPLYGTGICLLYIISELDTTMVNKIMLFACVTTLLEYLTGLFFLKYYKTRLWDYTKLKFNIQGLIAPLYSVFWTFLSLVFYFILYPYFYNKIEFLYEHLEFSLFVGVLCGVIAVDVGNALNIVMRLKKVAEMAEDIAIIDYEQLKQDIHYRFNELASRVEGFGEGISNKLEKRLDGLSDKINIKKEQRHKPTYLFPFKGEYNLRVLVQEHLEKLKAKGQSK